MKISCDEFWDFYLEIAGLGDEIQNDAFHHKPTDEKELVLNQKRKELGVLLMDEDMVMEIIKDNATMVKTRIYK